jgi:PleD family two-component response regulator
MATPVNLPSDPGLLMNRRHLAEPEGRLDWAPSASAQIPKANILLVDDRADKLLAIEAIVSSLGQNVVKARSGKEALRHLLHMDFAVILLDVTMPVMDGFETAALIRKRPSSEHTPIIFVTSINNSENHIAKGYSLGAVDYMLTRAHQNSGRGIASHRGI